MIINLKSKHLNTIKINIIYGDNMKKLFKEMKQYLDDFKYDLIMISHKRLVFKNQSENEYIEINNNIMIIEILEYLVSTKNNLTDIFNCDNVVFGTDDYLKTFLNGSQQIV